MKTTLITLSLTVLTFTAFAQEKLEREYRIKESVVPTKALDYVNSTLESANVKWYGEDNLNGKAIEAKGRYKGKLHSIEFNTEGRLQDVEIVIRFNDIPEQLRNTIEKDLESRFSKYRIQKTQIQHLGAPEDLTAVIRGEKTERQYLTNFEITLIGRKDGRTDYYEVLSNDKGELVRESKIVQRNNHHLIY